MGVGTSSKTISIRAFKLALHEVVRPENVRAAGPLDAFLGMQPDIVVEPETQEELARVLKMANDEGLAVIPRGGGTKLAWGNAPTHADVIVSTARLNRIVEHVWADLTVTVEAGCTMQNLQETLGKHGQRLALDAAWPDRATVGGVVSANESGALRLRFGAVRDLIIGVTLALPDGTLASSGGKVVKNVAGYDLPKLASGALGTLGVVTRAVFRLHPMPRKSRTLTILARDVNEIQRLILTIQDSKLAHTALQGRLWAGAPPEANILFEGTDAGLEAQQAQLTRLAGNSAVNEVAADVWNARQELWSDWQQDAGTGTLAAAAIAKISILPSSIVSVIQSVEAASDPQQLRWRAIIQATGIGWLRFDGNPQILDAALRSLRYELEQKGGSLTLLQKSAGTARFEAWGQSGDALPLMRAVKQQIDPRGTLNPGRFVGGI